MNIPNYTLGQVEERKENISNIDSFKQKSLAEIEKRIDKNNDNQKNKTILRYWEDDTWSFSAGAIEVELTEKIFIQDLESPHSQIKIIKSKSEKRTRRPHRFINLELSASKEDIEGNFIFIDDLLFVQPEIIKHLNSSYKNEPLEVKGAQRILRELEVKHIVRNTIINFCRLFGISNIHFRIEKQLIHFIDTTNSIAYNSTIELLSSLFNLEKNLITQNIGEKVVLE